MKTCESCDCEYDEDGGAAMSIYRVCVYKYDGDKPSREVSLPEFALSDIFEVERTDEQLRTALGLMLRELDAQSERAEGAA